MIIAKYFTDLTNIGHFILRMRFNKTLLYNIYVKFIFCFTINTLTASLDQDCETKRNGSKCQQLSGQVNNFSNTFSLFQFETKTTFYKQCWSYLGIWFPFKNFFLEKLDYKKTVTEKRT